MLSQWVLLFFVFLLGLIAFLLVMLINGKVEVPPATAVVVNNIWTGHTRAILPGTDFIIPGLDRVLEPKVILRNEAQNPPNASLVTGDGIELEVDFIIRKLQIGYAGMPTNWNDLEMDHDRLKDAIVKSVTTFEYAKHVDGAITRIIAKLQEALEHKTLNELFPEANLAEGKVGKVDKNLMQQIESEVNKALLEDVIMTNWCFLVEIDLEDYNQPAGIRKAREQHSSAKIAGDALKEKSEASGVDATVLVIADALSGIFGGTRKKGGES